MKAVAFTEYGPADRLRIVEVDKPVPTDDEILIRVRAASVNALDYHRLPGKPFFIRMISGFRKPKRQWLGVDVAGVVEAVGNNVTAFRPGDEIFGVARGSFAEYACTTISKVVIKSPSVSFEHAAALPVAGITALQGLRDKGKLVPGMKVLVNGAGGGVGTFAVQIAKAMGAEVTAVTSTGKLAMLSAIGEDHILDYTRDDFTAGTTRYDLIFDLGATHSLTEMRRVMTQNGKWLLAGGTVGAGWSTPLRNIFKGFMQSPFVDQKMSVVSARMKTDDLVLLQKLVDEGKIAPAISRTFPLRDTASAMAYVKEGRGAGKVVVKVA